MSLSIVRRLRLHRDLAVLFGRRCRQFAAYLSSTLAPTADTDALEVGTAPRLGIALTCASPQAVVSVVKYRDLAQFPEQQIAAAQRIYGGPLSPRTNNTN